VALITNKSLVAHQNTEVDRQVGSQAGRSQTQGQLAYIRY
jgi:hypothetical protein